MSSKSARRSTDYRRKKRHFCGNQHSKNETLEPVGIDVSSASSKKLCLDSGSYQSNSSESKGYRLINLDILLEELSKYLICFYCGSKAVLKEKVLFGLVSEFYIDCDSCAMQSTFKSSPVFESSNHDYEINTRITYAMRTLGVFGFLLGSSSSVREDESFRRKIYSYLKGIKLKIFIRRTLTIHNP
ncbi:hypothetical protein TNCT_72941 [Trichonephila clavata]|uniref:Uncharacterized protein n=1 Tax=Trichonephila clavata TaxID=2740835 RepID=A0A8X6IGB2_TRICU|nr:hypothetical protein TNCT_72941 [Trichonephila clavata]